MLIQLCEDRLGNVTARPVNERRRLAIAADMIRNGAPRHVANGTVFMQQPSVDEVRDAFGPRALYRGEVNDGARIRVDAWTFRQYCGYSAD